MNQQSITAKHTSQITFITSDDTRMDGLNKLQSDYPL